MKYCFAIPTNIVDDIKLVILHPLKNMYEIYIYMYVICIYKLPAMSACSLAITNIILFRDGIVIRKIQETKRAKQFSYSIAFLPQILPHILSPSIRSRRHVFLT